MGWIAALERWAKRLPGTVSSHGRRHEETWRLKEPLGTLRR